MNTLPVCGCPAEKGQHVHLPKLTLSFQRDAIEVGPALAGCYRCGTEMRYPIEDKTCPGCHVYHPKARPRGVVKAPPEPDKPRGPCCDQCHAKADGRDPNDCGGCP